MQLGNCAFFWHWVNRHLSFMFHFCTIFLEKIIVISLVSQTIWSITASSLADPLDFLSLAPPSLIGVRASLPLLDDGPCLPLTRTSAPGASLALLDEECFVDLTSPLSPPPLLGV